jgi:hypothetical protein
LTGDDVEDVTDGDGPRLAVGLAEGKEEGWFDGLVEVRVEGAVVEGFDDGEDGVAAAECVFVRVVLSKKKQKKNP